jgi:acyl-CoA dehydrogenase
MTVAGAKRRAGEAAGTIARELPGGVGFTAEQSLQRLLRRLWSWRDEFGGAAYWSQQIENTGENR